jgi:hypothetical protein
MLLLEEDVAAETQLDGGNRAYLTGVAEYPPSARAGSVRSWRRSCRPSTTARCNRRRRRTIHHQARRANLFQGDGTSDILLENSSTGVVEDWLMRNNAAVSTAVMLAAAPGNGWTIIDVGDFNGDGKSDILWRKANTGTAHAIGAPSAGWTHVGDGAANSDGTDDLLFESKAGALPTESSSALKISGSPSRQASRRPDLASTAPVLTPTSSSTIPRRSSPKSAWSHAAPSPNGTHSRARAARRACPPEGRRWPRPLAPYALSPYS